jgi:branched-chain amino acid aminotransferase
VSAAAEVDEGALRLFRTARTLLATAAPLPPGLEELRRRGLAAITVRTTSAGLLTGVKVTSYATALAAIAQAEKSGADDAIYLGEGETVLEATMSNVWWRENDVLVTPSLATGVLPGVTRGAVAALARGAGYRIREGSFTLPALLRAEEAFTSSAVREIMPLVVLDGRELPRGDAAPKLQALLQELADDYPEPDG